MPIVLWEQGANHTLAGLRGDDPLPVLDRIPQALSAEYAANEAIYRVGSTRGSGTWINHLTVPQNI